MLFTKHTLNTFLHRQFENKKMETDIHANSKQKNKADMVLLISE